MPARATNPRGLVVALKGLRHWFQEGAVTGGEEEVARLGASGLDRVLGKHQVAATAPSR